MNIPLSRQSLCYPAESISTDPGKDSVKISNPQRESPKASVSGTPNSVIVNDLNVEEELVKAEQDESNFFKVLSMNFYGRLKSNSVDNPRQRHKDLNIKNQKARVPSPKNLKAETASGYEKRAIKKPSLNSQSLIRRNTLALKESVTVTSENCSKHLLSTRVNSVKSSVIAIDAKKSDLKYKVMMAKQLPLLLESLQKTHQNNTNLPIQNHKAVSKHKARDVHNFAYGSPARRPEMSTKTEKSFDGGAGQVTNERSVKKPKPKVKRISSSSKESTRERETESLRSSKVLSQSLMDSLNNSMDDYTTKLKPSKKYYQRLVNSHLQENLKIFSRAASQHSEKDEELLKIDTGFGLNEKVKSKPKKTSVQIERPKSPAAFKLYERIPISLNSKIGNWDAKSSIITKKDIEVLKGKYTAKGKSSHSQDSKDQRRISSVEKFIPENIKLNKSKVGNSSVKNPELELDEIRKEERISLMQELYGGAPEKKRGRAFSPVFSEALRRSNPVDLLEKLLSHNKKTSSSFSTSIPN